MSNLTTQASATRYGAVTPSDSTILQFKRLYIGGAGAVSVKAGPGTAAVTFAAAPAGSVLDVVGAYVMSTNTTATNIVWLDW